MKESTLNTCLTIPLWLSLSNTTYVATIFCLRFLYPKGLTGFIPRKPTHSNSDVMSKQTGNFSPICLGLHFTGVKNIYYYVQASGRSPAAAVCIVSTYMHTHINVRTHICIVHAPLGFYVKTFMTMTCWLLSKTV